MKLKGFLLSFIFFSIFRLSAQATVELGPITAATEAARWAEQVNQWTKDMENFTRQYQLMQQMTKAAEAKDWAGTLDLLSGQITNFNQLYDRFDSLNGRDDMAYIQKLIYDGDMDTLKAYTELKASMDTTNNDLKNAQKGLSSASTALKALNEINSRMQSSKSKGSDEGVLESLQTLNMNMSGLTIILAEVAATSALVEERSRLKAENEAALEKLAEKIDKDAAAPPPKRKPISEKEMEDLVFGRQHQKPLWR
jgi:hypothetical protein